LNCDIPHYQPWDIFPILQVRIQVFQQLLEFEMNEIYHSSAKQVSDYCSIFSNPSRVLILWALSDQELSVSEIAESIHASIQNTSQHLRLMKDRDVVTTRRAGQMVYYRLSNSQNLEMCGLLERKPNSNQ
jgi:ArsR family transcriptional regulator